MIKKMPNWLTTIRMFMVPIYVILYYIGFEGWNYWAIGVFIVASLTDILDGYIARKYHCVSDFGKLMDPMADKLLVLAALMVILDCGRIEAWVALIIIAREFIISAYRLIAATKGVVIQAGWSGKIKTLTQDIGSVVILLNAPYFITAGKIILYISAALSVWSCAEYILKNKTVMTGELEMKEKEE